MNTIVTCTVKEAMELMKHLNGDDMVTLNIIDRREKIHSIPQRITKLKGEKLLTKAEIIEYQDNDIFGRFSLYGTNRENKNIIQNILFPQLE